MKAHKSLKKHLWGSLIKIQESNGLIILMVTNIGPILVTKWHDWHWLPICCQYWLAAGKCTDQLHIWCSHWPTIEGGPYRFWQKLGIQNGHWRPFWRIFFFKVVNWSKMARNAIESDLRSSIVAAGGHFVQTKFKKEVAYWYEMARNAIKSDFRSSKMGAGGHFMKLFQKIKKLRIYLKWREMRSNVIFSHQKWAPAAILWKNFKKLKSCVHLSEMARNAIKSDFRLYKMAASLWKVIPKK